MIVLAFEKKNIILYTVHRLKIRLDRVGNKYFAWKVESPPDNDLTFKIYWYLAISISESPAAHNVADIWALVRGIERRSLCRTTAPSLIYSGLGYFAWRWGRRCRYNNPRRCRIRRVKKMKLPWKVGVYSGSLRLTPFIYQCTYFWAWS